MPPDNPLEGIIALCILLPAAGIVIWTTLKKEILFVSIPLAAFATYSFVDGPAWGIGLFFVYHLIFFWDCVEKEKWEKEKKNK